MSHMAGLTHLCTNKYTEQRSTTSLIDESKVLVFIFTVAIACRFPSNMIYFCTTKSVHPGIHASFTGAIAYVMAWKTLLVASCNQPRLYNFATFNSFYTALKTMQIPSLIHVPSISFPLRVENKVFVSTDIHSGVVWAGSPHDTMIRRAHILESLFRIVATAVRVRRNILIMNQYAHL